MPKFQFQVSNVTAPMRYAQFYATLKRELGMPEAPRVLIFGCSTGEEIGTVLYFWPNAEVFACDIDESVLQRARAAYPTATVFLSSEEYLAKLSDFDLVCANSVFCRNPLPASGIAEIMPFSMFDHYCGLLSSMLQDDGFLFLYNTNYFFQHTQAAARFTPVNISSSWTAGFVSRLDPDGTIAAEAVLKGSVIQRFLVRSVQSVPSRHWLSASVFKKARVAGQDIIDVSTGIRSLLAIPELVRPALPGIAGLAMCFEPAQVAAQARLSGAERRFTQTYVSDFIKQEWALHGITCDA